MAMPIGVSSSPPPTHQSVRSPPRCSPDSSWTGTRSSPTRASRARTSKHSSPRWAPQLLRPDRRDERPRFGHLGGIRQWIESIIDQTKDQLSLERHGARKLPGLIARITQRLLALAAAIWFNWQTGQPGRNLTAYDH